MNEINVLAIDTATETLGICLKTKDNNILSLCIKMGFEHSKVLIPRIAFLLDQAKIKTNDIDLVVCSIGPGSFTGLRIGLATLKGFIAGIGCTLVGIPSLDAYAYSHFLHNEVAIPVIDARKKRYYSAFYQNGARISSYMDISRENLIKKIAVFKKSIITGPAAQDIYSYALNTINKKCINLDPEYIITNPYSLLKAGIQKYSIDKQGDNDILSPLYIRKSEAELNNIFSKLT